MFKIGDFSKLTQVSVRMLRYYDEQGLLKPTTVDSFTGYRFYSASQISRLHRIMALRDMGFLTVEIASILDEGLPDNAVKDRLQLKIKEIGEAIVHQKEKLRRLESFVQSLETESGVKMEVVLKNVPSYKVIGLREIIPAYNAEGMLWQKLGAYVGKNRIPCGSPSFAIYHDGEYREADVDVEVVMGVEKPVEAGDGFSYRETEAVPVMATIMVPGPYEGIGAAYESLAKWIEENGYRMAGLCRQVSHKGPWNEKEPKQYLAEIQIPVEKIK
ncbi:MAG: MerR family transcriptional regulator [Clostridia bacterium]|nr:MerR family transcriptional regulator [Clostridia bacterium]